MFPINYSEKVFQNHVKISGADILLEYLKTEGIQYVFGVTGGTITPIIEALDRTPEIQYIMAKHESGAAFMADFYARISGKLGVCLSTAGPGATNMITGVACANQDNTPILAVTGQPATHTLGKGAVQESSEFGVDIAKLYGGFCGMSVTVREVKSLSHVLSQALRQAQGRHKQAVHVSIPTNVASAVLPEIKLPTDPESYRVSYSSVDREQVKKAARVLLDAENPVILLGSRANAVGCSNLFLELAEIMNCPVITTPRGKGSFPEDHYLSFRVFGFAGSPCAKNYLYEHTPDLLLVIGSSLCEWATESWDQRINPEKYLIHIDSDPMEIGKNYPVSQGIVGDIATCIKVLINKLKGKSSGDGLSDVSSTATGFPLQKYRSVSPLSQEGWMRLKQETGKFLEPEKRFSEEIPLKPQRLMQELNECLDSDAVVIADAGNSYAWTLHYLTFNPPQRFIIPLGFASMGHGTAGVIGAKLGAPNRQTVVISGDGSALMNGSEIHTAVEYNIQVIWVILNDGGWGMVDHGSRIVSGRSMGAKFHKISFADLAVCYGAKGYYLNRAGQLKKIMDKVKDYPGPAVIEAAIDEKEEPPFMERVRAVLRYKQQQKERN